MLTNNDLRKSCGSFTWTYSALSPEILISEGLQYVAEKGNAYWLIDAIASHEIHNPNIINASKKDAGFDYIHFWTLKVNLDNHTAVLSCRQDDGYDPIVIQNIEYTNFPLAEITVYAGRDGEGYPKKLYMPSEY